MCDRIETEIVGTGLDVYRSNSIFDRYTAQAWAYGSVEQGSPLVDGFGRVAHEIIPVLARLVRTWSVRCNLPLRFVQC